MIITKIGIACQIMTMKNLKTGGFINGNLGMDPTSGQDMESNIR